MIIGKKGDTSYKITKDIQQTKKGKKNIAEVYRKPKLPMKCMLELMY